MAIQIKVGDSTKAVEQPEKIITKVTLEIRKTLDGDFLITDHADIDIIVMPTKKKIVAFPKDIMSEVVYGAQDRLFKYLSKKGVIAIYSIQGGSIYGSIEAEILGSEDFNPISLVIINIEKFIDEERPYFEFAEEYEDMDNDRFVEPDEDQSTELGEVPHEKVKGNIRPGYNYGPYWQSYMLEQKQRGE